MTKKPGIVFAVFLLSMQAAAADREISIPWAQLGREVEGRKIRMGLPNGTRIEGKAVAVGPEELRVRITKTSDERGQPRGPAVFPRNAVTLVEVVRHGVRSRIIGTVVGPLLVGAAAAGVIQHTGADDLRVAAILTLGGMVGAGVGGYYLGKRADRRVVAIRIVP